MTPPRRIHEKKKGGFLVGQLRGRHRCASEWVRSVCIALRGAIPITAGLVDPGMEAIILRVSRLQHFVNTNFAVEKSYDSLFHDTQSDKQR